MGGVLFGPRRRLDRVVDMATKHTHVMTEAGTRVLVGKKSYEYGAKLTAAEAKAVGLSRCKTVEELADREKFLGEKAKKAAEKK